MKNKLILAEKFWRLKRGLVDEQYLYCQSTFQCYADTRDIAKSKIFKKLKEDSVYCFKTGDEFTYLDVQVVREKDFDKFFFEDTKLTKYQIEEQIAKKERIDKLNNLKGLWYYVKKGGYFYKHQSKGYTEYVVQAGVYSREEAVKHAKSCEDLVLVEINIENHNKEILDHVEILKKGLIIKN